MDQETELIELAGSVQSVIYKNEENGYTVLSLVDQNGESITVVGCFPFASAGESMILSGTWTTHNVHGKQFKAEYAQRIMPSTVPAIYDYLAGGALKGIGPATALLIVNKFGERSLDVLENSPDELAQLRGISRDKARAFSEEYRRQNIMRRLMDFTCSFDLRPILAVRLYRYYGESAIQILRNDPYILTATHIGGSFAEADHLAAELGIEMKSPNRIAAAVLYELEYNTLSGHCFLPFEKLSAATAQMIDVESESVDDMILTMGADNRLIIEEIAHCRACYLPRLYEAESYVAARIGQMAKEKCAVRADLGSVLSSLERTLGIRYAESQRNTLKLALENKIIAITGGPGTGKTTSIRAILALFGKMGLKTLLAAPTGRAAKRMTELTGQEASTIHRLLGAQFAEDGTSVVFTKNAGDLLSCDAVILDECSMIDVELMSALLDALPDEARLILVGDADQLPSVGPGDVFSAILRSNVLPSVRLTEVFRQNETGLIVRNAHMINRGEHPDLGENKGDFFRLNRFSQQDVSGTVLDLFSVRLPQKMNIPPCDIQVLTPTRKGELGTVELNRRLQERLNPPAGDKREKPLGSAVFREGDRVIQTRNDYDINWTASEGSTYGTGIYNGDIGTIEAIEPEKETVTVDFDGRRAEYPFEKVSELEHAWAMTVHKSQGSEFRAVIFVLSASSRLLLTRSILYTGVTRAKELMIMVGDENVAHTMIDNVRPTRRYNALRLRLVAAAH